MTDRPRLRVALVGCGHISGQHGPAWLASPDAELVAVCDQDEARARRRAAEWGVARAYADVAEMLDRERLDALDVVTRPETHTALVTLAAQRGLAVLCQKPLAPTLDEARAMVETCQRAGVRFMVTEMWRYLPWFRALRDELARGAVGRPHYLRIVGSRRAMRRERPVNDQQPYFADMPRLIVYEMMIHWIDAARCLFGDVERVFARGARINPAIAGEDWALVVMTHRGGATTALDHSWATPPGPEGALREGDVWLEGSEGALRFDAGSGELLRTTFAETSLVARFSDVNAGFQAAFDGCIGEFASAVRTDRPFESAAEDNLKTLAATLAAYDSMASGQAVELA